MIQEEYQNTIDAYTKSLIEDPSVFQEVPISLKEFLYSRSYLHLPDLSEKQFDFVQYGTQIYFEKEIEELGWNKVRPVGELVAFWGKGCFTGDTKISLLNGKEISFEELEREYKDKKFWVYSYDNEKGIIAGLASNPRITKEVNELIEIELDNGEMIRCTLEHQYMLRNGSYKKAENLQINDSLMPLYRKMNNQEHEALYNPFCNKWELTHRVMYRGDIEIGNVIHHKNQNKRDNRPENLDKLENKNKHFSLHNVLRNDSIQGKLAVNSKINKLNTDINYRDAYCTKMKHSMNKADVLKKISESVKKTVNEPEFKKRFKVRMKEVCSTNEYKLNMSIVKKNWYKENNGKLEFELWKKERARKCNEARWGKKILNHKVISINRIQLPKPVPVYDITVEGCSNFALSSGVFVHNSGKDFCSSIIQARIAYLLLCLKNPQMYYSMASVTAIDMLNMAYSSNQASYVFFKMFSSMIDDCRWFNNKCEIKNSMIKFPKNIAAYSGNSFEEAMEGKNLILCVLDEISAFKTKIEVEMMSLKRIRAPRYSAESVYDMAKSSVESRFPNGIGKVISLSFPRFKNDFIQQLYTKGKEEKTCYVSYGSTWEINPVRKKSDFDDEFRKNPERAEARYACNPKAVEGGYFKNKDAVSIAFPLIPVEQVPTTSDRIPQLKDWLRCSHGNVCSVHIDLGVKYDKAGFCMSHVSRFVDEIRSNEEGEKILVQKPVVTIDLITSFIAPINGEIDFSVIRQMVMDLINKGFRIGKLTTDSWQSTDFLQIINKLGIETDVRSVDRKTDAYDCLKELIYDNRLKGYSYIREIESSIGQTIQMNEVVEELENLVYSGRKVEHTAVSSKDISDSLAGSVQGAIEIGFSGLVASDIELGSANRVVMEEGFINEDDREYLEPAKEVRYFA